MTSVDANDAEHLRLRYSNNLDDLLNFESKYMAPIHGFSWKTMFLKQRIIPETAASGVSVLVIGETGTGKELVVKEIAKTAGLEKKLVSVNCAAIPSNLIESELFGHAKGAFTGAVIDKKGYFHEANGGAIFLDEIGELESSLQAKLLRVIEQREFFRVGDTKPTPVSTRLFAATNKPGKLRQDIEWRFPEHFRIPPLRERREDVFAVLFAAFGHSSESDHPVRRIRITCSEGIGSHVPMNPIASAMGFA